MTCDMTSTNYFGKMNSTLGSVVPLAMFLILIDINKFFTLALLNECDSDLLAISTQHLGSQKNFVPAPRSSIFQFQSYFSHSLDWTR